jgi:hypothetical protein
MILRRKYRDRKRVRRGNEWIDTRKEEGKERRLVVSEKETQNKKAKPTSKAFKRIQIKAEINCKSA